MDSSNDTSPEPGALVLDLIQGAWRAQASRAMAELRLADALVEPGTAEQVAERVEAHAPTLERLLRTLAALGLVSCQERTFTLTPAGSRLRSDVPGSDWGAMMMMVGPWTLATWSRLADAVRTGAPAFQEVHGEPFWEFLRSHEEVGRIFDAAMARQSKDHAAVALVLAEVERSGAAVVVDVGGGTGRLLGQVLAARPGLRGILADQEGPVTESVDVFSAYGVDARCEAVVCDFFDRVPEGGDGYIVSNILHDWDDERCREILSRIHDAAVPGAQVLVLETVMPEGQGAVSPASAPLHLLDLMMLLNFGARERTLSQYSALLQAAGFGDIRLTGGTGPHLVTATRT